MRVIFLDVDGVLNNVYDINRGVELEETKLQIFADLVKSTNAKVVLSSSWRLSDNTFSEVEITLHSYGVNISDVTPTLPARMYGRNMDRGDEIAAWIKLNNPDQYAIIDDVDDGLSSFGESFFKTSFDEGLTLEISNRILEHLK
jgi:hypothetical protein